MASGADKVIALINIYPMFAELILNGTKLVEFRKTRFSRPISHLLLYATAPISKVVGAVSVSQIHQASPQYLWRKYGKIGGITRKDFFSYFGSSNTGIAILIADTYPFVAPIGIDIVSGKSTPPRGFTYLEEHTINKILDETVGVRL